MEVLYSGVLDRGVDSFDHGTGPWKAEFGQHVHRSRLVMLLEPLAEPWLELEDSNLS